MCRDFPGSVVPLANEVCDSRVGRAQRLLIGKKYDTEMLRTGLLPEAGAVDYHHVLLADEFLDEDLVALRDVDSRVGVESSARGYATHTRGGLAPFLREIAAGTKLAPYFDEMVLRAFERGLDGVLLGMVRAQARPQKAVDAFRVGLHGCGIA